MAAPADMTTLDITGKYIMNKTLTDGTKTDNILYLQGVGWATRKVISLATVTLFITHTKEEGVEQIHIDQKLTGGITADPENFTLNWTERHTENRIFGPLVIKARRSAPAELDVDWLKNGWTADTFEHGLIETLGQSDTPKSNTTWTAHQTWGFEETEGVRRYTRHVKFTGPKGEDVEVKMYYDYPPSALLDVDATKGGRRLYLPIESTVSRITRPLRRPWIFALLVVAYIIGIAFLSKAQSFSANNTRETISCTSTFWLANSQCGLEGQLCLPLNTSLVVDFRCPSGCEHTILQNPRTVGADQQAFVPLIVGGGDEEKTYRADSFICAAAQQTGVVSSSSSRCGRLSLVNGFTDFLPYSANGLDSIGFPSFFPLAFRLSKGPTTIPCDHNLSEVALAVNAMVFALIFIVFQPPALVLFWSIVCIGFWHVSLFSDPAQPIPDLERQFGLFLPLLYIAYVFWRAVFRHTLPFIAKAPIEAAVLYGLPFWVGVLNNRTFDLLPLSRLTSSDLNKRSGALATLIVIILVVVVCAINQVRVIRKTGWLPFYLGWYVVGALAIMVLALLPTLSLRIHHYILPMLLLPATAFPTRLSAIYQGLLLGLFLHGSARWGYASIVESAATLRQDAILGSLIPTFLTTSATWNSTIPLTNQTLTWVPIPEGERWAGFSLLIDDVEKYVGVGLQFSLAALDPLVPHFFRLAFKSDTQLGDYTNAATLWPNGTWVDPMPGGSY
ncbi:LCCL domain-containing protein [Coprinopsis sp. MPI-PUGE-AT-0042]|nr:LCCL domain-containing protein [Coprinopsis sp. MPI-PUGE-AT-0042]